MPTYQFEAMDASGQEIRDVLEAPSEEEAQATIRQMGYFVTKISVKKGTPDEWLEVHRAAHEIGYRTTATMMFGHLETDRDIVEHLDRVRALQDDTGGFFAFIPWSFYLM